MSRLAITALLASQIALGCGGEIDGPPAGLGASGSGVATAGTGIGAAGSNAVPSGAAGTSAAPPGPGAAGGGALPASGGRLPARLRRLTNAEFDASARALLGVESKFGESFTPDTRQGGFTRNDSQRVDPVFITQLSEAAQKLAAMAKANLNNLAPCSDAAGNETCAKTFVTKFSERAYRRPATPREIEALVTVYRAGSDGATYADGIEAVVTAVLQSPGFLYVTEIGAGTPAAPAKLTDYEIAAQLAYLLTGAPPDDALLQAAKAGQLAAADARTMHARRLLMTQASSKQVVRMVHEWLGIDRIVETAKDSNVYPEFSGLRDAMKREADEFVTEVMWKSGSNVRELFAADWTNAEDNLARLYLNGQQPQRVNNHVSLTNVRRRGILNQAAFLSVYAHATETAPVLRGVALLRRIACANVPSPTSLNLNVVPPVPDPSKTTRERFTVHSKDAACASCHKSIDALGFSFESLDGMGRERKMENGRPVDSATTLMSGYTFDGSFKDSMDLVLKLADSSELRSCFARQLFRFAAARSDTAAQPLETDFVNAAALLPVDAQGKLAELLVAFVASDTFVQRGVSP